MRLLRLLSILLISLTLVQAMPSGLELKEAQLSYENALSLEGEAQTTELKKAKRLYENALKETQGHAYLHYNLGTVLLKLKDYGPSIFHLEQAYALNNDDARIVGNLERARLLAGLQGKPQQEENDVSSAFKTTWKELNPKALQFFAIALSIGLSIWMFIKGLGKAGLNLWISLVLCSCLMFLAHAHANQQWMDKKAILLVPENPRSGIGASYPGLLKDDKLKAGSAGTLVRQESGYVEVSWDEGLRGWVKAEQVGIIQ